MKIRKCRESDMTDLIDINKKTLKTTYSDDFWESMATSENECIKRCDIVEDDGKNVGYAAWKRRRREMRLWSLGMLPEYRGMGMASTLLKKGIEEILKCNIITTKVRESNASARDLYDRCGFEKVERLEGYYADGEDALQLQLNEGKFNSLLCGLK